MGLLRLLAFPLTVPIDSFIWVADQVLDRAEHELYSPERIRQQLAELELALDLGQIDEEAYTAAEDALIDRLREARARMRT
ncbi:MAG: gas vesicle protein [Candidatus Viridilinea halotolerans]|uniref:Gas vesicle protein n=1 Tax=Candidatus Viridilinea halotolerans TaxID=2491704 RepID=A0A426U858_9CHLR|nr:MAG: gas vesicle protein [Candidatus Viridilinea halotolerans]